MAKTRKSESTHFYQDQIPPKSLQKLFGRFIKITIKSIPISFTFKHPSSVACKLTILIISAIFISSSLALDYKLELESTQLQSSQGIKKCLSSFTSIEICVVEIFSSFFKGKIGLIGPACCNAILKLSENCWPKLFPLDPFFPPELKKSCRKLVPAPAPAPSGIVMNFRAENLPMGMGEDLDKCWGPLVDIKGCVNEIFEAILGGKKSVIGPVCCKAITKISISCWLIMFPENPSSPQLLLNLCHAPAPARGPAAFDLEGKGN